MNEFISERLLKLRQMEEIVHFLQITVAKDFGYENNLVVESLQVAMEELRKARMDLPPKPTKDMQDEMPTKPFGLFVPPSVEQILGRRTVETEKDLVSGKRKSIRELRPQIPADGGPERIPTEDELDGEAIQIASNGNSGIGDYDTMTTSATTPAAGSRASIGDYQSSRTSYLEGSEEGSSHTGSFNRPASQTTSVTSPTGVSQATSPTGRIDSITTPLTLRSSQLSIAEANEILEKQEKQEKTKSPELNSKQNGPINTGTSLSQVSDYDNMDGPIPYGQSLDKTLESDVNNSQIPEEYGQHVSVIDISNYESPPGRHHSPGHKSNVSGDYYSTGRHSGDYPSPSRQSNHSYQSGDYPSPSGHHSSPGSYMSQGGIPEHYRSDDARFILMTAPSPSPTMHTVQHVQMNGSVDHLEQARYPLSNMRSPASINGFHQTHHHQQYTAYTKVPRSQTTPIIEGSQPIVLTTAPIKSKPAYKSSVYL